ncbi:hypothetical protein [Actinoallomurus iriomotensis]|uniref:Uncharacterized protein n=1 Tax=Actinoallomurus iriomotensis TaxID=478107 RepID=A0A9W6W060_9ACTN|nr:hypothetical protein [Actinoallomurus iriomotensis]GLY86034.1 hypothetical protein Airi02_039630 [Actinoallomurus iriomotensis]
MSTEASPSFLPGGLAGDQIRFLQVVYDGFSVRGDWPIWQYVDMRLDGEGIDAAAVFASFPPLVSNQGASQYALVQRSTRHEDNQATVRLTVAGLRFVLGAEPLLDAFLTTVRLIIGKERSITPDPAEEVEATLASDEVKEQLALQRLRPPEANDLLIAAVGKLLQDEPPRAWSVMGRSGDGGWQMRLITGLSGVRALREVGSIDGYVERIVLLLTPAPIPAIAPRSEPMDLPLAIGYLDTTWKVKTGRRLFVNLQADSCARLAQPCASQEEFNSAMSALADVLSCVVPLSAQTPPKFGALAGLKNDLPPGLPAEAEERIKDAVDLLLTVNHIRHGQQHGDAKQKAVAAHQTLGVPYPPYDWADTWGRLVAVTRSALDSIREEMQAALPDKAT